MAGGAPLIDDAVLTVTELAMEVQQLLAAELGPVRVRGEVSRFTAARSGHWYFTLADADSVIDCAMFRGANRAVRRRPRVGDEIEVRGHLDLYAPRGQLSLIARRLVYGGEGDLQARLEALKRKLAAEGLLDPARKRLLPPLPGCIAVATSPTGAALQDVLRVLGDRFPSVPVLVAPCRVQGDAAPTEVAAALDLIAQDGRADVIIVGRGGGSQEDLMAFNTEPVARAIARMPVPVVSAVGHETDISIADLVADVRAATPSHAAELVVPDRRALQGAVAELGDRLRLATHRRLSRARDQLISVKVPPPELLLVRGRQRVERAGDRLVDSSTRMIQQRRARLDTLAGRLSALSPSRVLDRGYAIVRTADGQVVSRAGQASVGASLAVQLQDGALSVTVDHVTKRSTETPA